MLYSEFPRSGERISRLGFGAMGLAGWFGDQSEQEHIDSLHRAMDLGVNFVDTAGAYGASERILGLALKQWSGRRPFLATKIEGLAGNTQWAYPPSVESTFPPGHITADAERSLKALGVEQVDLMQLHIYWPLWGTGGYWMDELEELRRSGKARFIGVSVPLGVATMHHHMASRRIAARGEPVTSKSRSRINRQFDRIQKKVPFSARVLEFLRRPASKVIRIPIGILLILGGIFSFLPILGLWMLPLGLLLLALDVAFLRTPVSAAILRGSRKWTTWRRNWRAGAGR